MKYSNPKIKEGINTSHVNPLKGFSFLVGVVLTAFILIAAVFVIMIDYTIDYIPFDFEASIANNIPNTLWFSV